MPLASIMAVAGASAAWEMGSQNSNAKSEMRRICRIGSPVVKNERAVMLPEQRAADARVGKGFGNGCLDGCPGGETLGLCD